MQNMPRSDLSAPFSDRNSGRHVISTCLSMTSLRLKFQRLDLREMGAWTAKADDANFLSSWT